MLSAAFSSLLLFLLLDFSFSIASSSDPVCDQIRSVATKWGKEKSVTKVLDKHTYAHVHTLTHTYIHTHVFTV